VWAYALVVLLFIGAATSGGTTEDSSQTNEGDQELIEPAGDPEPEQVTEADPSPEAFAGREWEAQVAAVATSSASPIAKGDEIDSMVKQYSMTEADIAAQVDYLVDQVRTRTIVSQAEDRTYMFRLMFIARSVDKSIDDEDMRPEDGFAFDAYQVARDLARGTETPDSDFIQANLEQLDRAIFANGW